ncbi:NepR family anti-sigma factor [Blastomonas sp. AAP53]|uniref:NepR family anti-sigma factor n=1 Tax=Blastomonas sp. AAP53 TaxID=1248760 RepID=UPI001930D899|nr:NepR family anti-sigma factor [Blastomonas sp. AAP53]
MRTSCFDPMLVRQARIGHSLRQVYDGVTESPLPDQFEDLLSQLDKIGEPGCQN